MNIIQRVGSPTPDFFKKIRNIGLILAAISATIFASPIALPALVVQCAGYVAVAAGVASAISQVTTNADAAPPQRLLEKTSGNGN